MALPRRMRGITPLYLQTCFLNLFHTVSKPTFSLFQFAPVLTALLVALQSQGSGAQAPGDEDARCQTGMFAHDYPVGVVPLMDTRSYEQLLGVRNAVWHEVDFDDNNGQNSYVSRTKVRMYMCV